MRFRRVSIAAGCYVLAFALWLVLISPANATMKQWSVDNPPATWTMLRDRWEYTHLARFGLQVFGLGALVLAALPEARRKSKEITEDRAA